MEDLHVSALMGGLIAGNEVQQSTHEQSMRHHQERIVVYLRKVLLEVAVPSTCKACESQCGFQGLLASEVEGKKNIAGLSTNLVVGVVHKQIVLQNKL